MFVLPSAWMVSIWAMIACLVGHRRQRPDPAAVVFEDQHAHLVARPEHVDGRPQGLLGQVDVADLRVGGRVVHGTGDVQHQDHRQGLLGLVRPLFGDHRQDLFQRRVDDTCPAVNEWSPPMAISPPRSSRT